jgi:hypothetical protein
MDPLIIGVLIAVLTIVVLATGIPVAFGLGLVSVGFLLAFEGADSLSILGETFFAGLAEFSLVSIPMFIVMGAAVASSPAGKDLYLALDRWLNRVPGGLIISNIGACSVFAALSGSSPATCAAIGKMGIPEMRERGFPDGLATGAIAAGGTLGILIPPSITMIVYGIATETSIGRLFIAGLLPGLMLTVLFMAWSLYTAWRHGYSFADLSKRFTLREKLEVLPRVLPFLAIIARGAAARAAVPGDHCRRALRALRRRGHPVRGGRRRGHVLPGADRRDLPCLAAAAHLGNHLRLDERERDDPDDHRRLRALCLHDVAAVRDPVGGRVHRHHGRQ